MLILAITCTSLFITMGMPTAECRPETSNENEVPTYDFPFYTRSQWNARKPKDVTSQRLPVPFVVIHHSYVPKTCYNNAECSKAMRSMQDFHMDGRGWWDIGYNFGVGSDGAAYEGRGWTYVGAHALHFNNVSIGICLIGDWTSSVPPSNQLKTARALIESGVELGFISPNYKLVGHRQVRDTECPGDALFREILSWPHYNKFPSSYKDLQYALDLLKNDRS